MLGKKEEKTLQVGKLCMQKSEGQGAVTSGQINIWINKKRVITHETRKGYGGDMAEGGSWSK